MIITMEGYDSVERIEQHVCDSCFTHKGIKRLQWRRNVLHQIVANMTTRHISAWPYVVMVNNVSMWVWYSTFCKADVAYIAGSMGNTHIVQFNTHSTVRQMCWWLWSLRVNAQVLLLNIYCWIDNVIELDSYWCSSSYWYVELYGDHSCKI